MPVNDELLDDKWSNDNDAALPIEAAKLNAPKGGTDIDDKDEDLGAPKGGIDETDADEESAVRAVLRMDKEKVFRKDGSARPADYILDRVKALDGVAVEEAVKMEFKDSKGKLKKYKKKDLDYDVGKWLIVEIEKDSDSCHTCADDDGEAER